jgi:hypothetical protein
VSPLSLVLVAAGVVAVAVGALRIRAPLATIRRLDETAANLDRYDTWRGRSTDVEAEGPTGADEMRALMRREGILWGGLVVVGIVLIVAGLAAG